MPLVSFEVVPILTANLSVEQKLFWTMIAESSPGILLILNMAYSS